MKEDTFDYILTNPPFVVSGSKDYSKIVKQNNKRRRYYSEKASGVEGLFAQFVVKSRPWNKTEMVYANRTETERYTTTAFGRSVLIGVEYWFVDNISLSGEQSISLEYTIYRDSKGFEIRNATSSLLLSVYF